MVIFVLFILFFATIYFLSTLLRAIKQSHLRHPPSPPALPIVGHLHFLGPIIHRSFHDLSSRYGPLIHLRIGSIPCVIASTPEIAKEFLKTQELTFSSRMDFVAIKLLTNDFALSFAPYGPYWKFIKKLCVYQLLGTRTLTHFLPIRTNEIKRFLEVIMDKAKGGESVNVTKELLKLTNNVISMMMLSIRSSGSEGEAEEAKTLVREVTQIFGEFNVSDFVRWCKNVDLQGIRKRSEGIHGRYDVLLEKIIKERERRRRDGKRGGDEAKDFLDMLLDVLEDEESEVKITRDHIKALLLDFFTAATDTTAVAVEWALAELINNPKILKKAQKEVDEVIGKHRLVEESDGPHLPYIQAIIKETFRLHPPVPLITRRSVQDCTINGYNISANTLLFVNVWSIGRDPKYWENPLEFRPERFIEPGKDGPLGPVDVKGQHFQLLPFGSGRRGCPGISLAMQELPMVIAAMVQCFEWKVLADGSGVVDMSERPGLTVPRAHDLVCVPVARIGSLDIFSP